MAELSLRSQIENVRIIVLAFSESHFCLIDYQSDVSALIQFINLDWTNLGYQRRFFLRMVTTYLTFLDNRIFFTLRNSASISGMQPDLPAFTTTIPFQVHQGCPSASLSSPVRSYFHLHPPQRAASPVPGSISPVNTSSSGLMIPFPS